MSNDTPPRRRPSELITQLLDRGYTRTARTVTEAISQGLRKPLIQQRLQELEAIARQLEADGERMNIDNPVLRALTADLGDELAVFQRLIDNASGDLQGTGANAGAQLARELTLPGMTDDALDLIGLAWNTPDPEAVASLVDVATSQAWRDRVSTYDDTVLDTINNQAIIGIARGWGPVRVARSITEKVATLPRSVAEQMMRTLMLNSYRRAQAVHYAANSDIIETVIRVAALDSRTCIGCIALHGTRVPPGEVIHDHPNGRCTGVGQLRGRPLNIRSGRDWFDDQPDSFKQTWAKTNGRQSALEALERGDVQWDDFAQDAPDPVYGRALKVLSLKRARQRPDRRVDTIYGQMPPDRGTPGSTIEELNEFLALSDGPLARTFWGDTYMPALIGYDDEFNLVIKNDNVYEVAKLFVKEMMDIQYGEEYTIKMVTDIAAQNGVEVSGQQAVGLFNRHFQFQAQAILKAAEIGGVRLTEPQRRRLGIALEGRYSEERFDTRAAQRGSLRNRMVRSAPRLSGVELREARKHFMHYVQGIDDVYDNPAR